MAKYHVFTDGSSKGNPGAGGWGMVVMNEAEDTIVLIESDTDGYTTNNRMELRAMICALNYATSNPRDQFIIFSDSAYVVNSFNSWIDGWAANNWRNSKKQEVENVELMRALYEFKKRDFPNFEVRKCSGHSGNAGNELADALATSNKHKYRDVVETWELNIAHDDCITTGDFWFPID